MIIKTCPTCSKTFDSFPSQHKRFCSQSCARRSIFGERHPRWKGGTAHTVREKLAAQLSAWRKAVYQRDNYTCQKCGYKGKELNAHHIKGFSDYPEFRFDVSNGLTACLDCHGKIHGKSLRALPGAFPKFCELCERPTSGRSRYCRSCSISQWHIHRGEIKHSLTCARCGNEFETYRNSKYCSLKCQRSDRHTGKTFPCANCGNPVYRQPSLIKRNKTGLWFCSEKCQAKFVPAMIRHGDNPSPN